MLKDRNHFPPGGFRFRQPETGWDAPRHLSFDDTVTAIIKHRKANPRHNLSTETAAVAAELENYTVARLKKMAGGEKYLIAGTEPIIPKSVPLRESAAKLVAEAKKYVSNTVAGASLWAKWFPDGRTETREVATARAAVCIACPSHIRGSMAQRFNSVVGRELQAVFGALSQNHMETDRDSELHVCDVCDCPMRVKVWVPLDMVRASLKDETRARLPANCWILKS